MISFMRIIIKCLKNDFQRSVFIKLLLIKKILLKIYQITNVRFLVLQIEHLKFKLFTNLKIKIL